MEYQIRSFKSDEAILFYADTGKNQQRRCIGYLRGDFGRDGRAFWTSWWERNTTLKTPDFQQEFDRLINTLRADSLLKNRNNMTQYCSRYPEARIPGAWHSDVFGFCVDTDRHSYFLRCLPHHGDYNFYIFCYRHKERTHNKAKPQQQQPSAKKHREPER